jgi:uncharacterized protein YyaL (SSP411 family)
VSAAPCGHFLLSVSCQQALGALAEGAIAFERPDYREAGIRTAEFLLRALKQGDHLRHSWYNNQTSGEAFLEDYAFLAEGLLKLYAATLEERWLSEAVNLAHIIEAEFWDSAEGAFYDTSTRHESLIIRPTNKFDSAYPSGGSAAVNGLLRLARSHNQPEYETIAESAIKQLGYRLAFTPAALSNWLNAVDFQTSPTSKIVIAGAFSDAATTAMLKAIGKRYLPNLVLLGYDPASLATTGVRETLSKELSKQYPVTEGKLTTYVCTTQTCFPPVHSAMELRQILDAASNQRV